MSQIKWVIIAELLLDSGTEYVSGERVRRRGSPNTIIYSGTVERWGAIEKSIPCPPGMPHIGGAAIRIRDNFRKWRDLLANQTPRRRVMQITVLPAGASVADYAPVYVGEVVDIVFTTAALEVSLQDRTYAWLDELIPAMAVKEIFPDISADDEGGFIPIVFGDCVSPNVSPSMPQGVIPLPHIGMISGKDRWAASATPILGLVLYRRQTTSVDEESSTPEWVVVDESEYEIASQTVLAADNPYGLFELNFTHVDFLEQQSDGTEIRADIRGIYQRGAWGSLDAEDGSLADPPVTLRNPIDGLINMSYFLLQKAGLSTDALDTEEIAALRAQFETLELKVDGALTEAMTGREWLGRYLPAFNLDMYCRRGLITFAYSTTTPGSPPAAVPTFKEGKHIVRNTFVERLPEKVVTQMQYRFEYDNANSRFASSAIAGTADQNLLNLPDGSEKIEKDVVDLYFVRDATTAAAVMTQRLLHLALGAYRQSFEMPMPATLDDVELAQFVNLTHSMGLAIGGYVDQQAKILNVTLDLDRLVYKLETILYPPVSVTHSVAFDTIAVDSGVLWSSGATGPITPVQDHELIISCMAGREGPYAVDSGLTITDQVPYTGSHFGGALAYKIQSAAATINATWTQTGISMAILLASFKASSGTFALLSHAAAGSADTVNVVTPPIDTSGAALLLMAIAEGIGVAGGPGSSSYLTDSKGNTWALAGGVAANFNEHIVLYYCVNPAAGTGHTFAAVSFPASNPSLCVAAFS